MELNFTDLTIDSAALVHPRYDVNKKPTWKASWKRILISHQQMYFTDNDPVQDFLEENFPNSVWDYYTFQGQNHFSINYVIAFENSDDAMMFKLLGGDKIFQDLSSHY